MTATLTYARTGTCWDCGGPCLTYKGSAHGWRCRTCCDAYLAAGAAKAAEADARDRAKRAAKMNSTAYGELRRGTPVASAPQLSVGGGPDEEG